jgi:glycosyltransferase involved in cell wall biosynthesis
MVPPGDVEALAAQMEIELDRGTPSDADRSAHHEWVVQRYSMDVTAARYEEVLSRCASASRASPTGPRRGSSPSGQGRGESSDIAEGQRILMLASHPGAPGPVPRLTGALVDAVRDHGWPVEMRTWGRRPGEDDLLQRAVGRARDIQVSRATLGSLRPNVLLVVTAHDWPALLRDLPLLLLTRRQGLTRVVLFHGSNAQRLRRRRDPLRLATALLAKQADGVLVLSSEEADQWAAEFPRTPAFVVRNVFVPPSTTEARAQATEPSRRSVPVVLFVGRVLRQKGVFTLLDAFQRLQSRAEVSLRIVGDGEDLEALRTEVAARHLEGSVTLDGRLEGSDLIRAYESAEVLALPTMWPEGFPTVLLEAMWAGVPIVTTRSRGAADTLRDGTNALFAPPENPEELAKAIETLLSDAGLAQRMRAANHRLLAEFAAEPVSARYLTVLRWLTLGSGDIPSRNVREEA